MAGGGSDELGDAADVETRERKTGDAGEAAQLGQGRPEGIACVGGCRPVRPEDHGVGQALIADHLVQEVDGRSAAPVQIVEYQEQRPVGGEEGDRRDHGASKAGSLGIRVAVTCRFGKTELSGAPRDESRQLRRVPANPIDDSCWIDDGEEVIERLGERLVGDRLFRGTGPVEHGRATSMNRAGELGLQSRLACARLAGQQDDSAGARCRGGPRLLERPPSVLARHKRDRRIERQQRRQGDRLATDGSWRHRHRSYGMVNSRYQVIRVVGARKARTGHVPRTRRSVRSQHDDH